MKKIGLYVFLLLLSSLIFLLGFDYNIIKQPNKYYQVYLDDEAIGIITSRKELEDYINSQADTIRSNVRDYKQKIEAIDTFSTYELKVPKENNTVSSKIEYLIENKDTYNLTDIDIENLNRYRDEKLYTLLADDIENMRDYINSNSIYEYADEVYTPNGIEIKKVYTYNTNIMTVEEIYKEIISKKSCTISGYKFVIKGLTEEDDDLEIYTLDKDIFSNAIEELITIFVDESKYQAYKTNTQPEITTVGSIIENIYVNQEISYKAVNIDVAEKIYTSSKDLSAYLLYGEDHEENVVKVKAGDSVESISLENKISVQEFLISNPQYTSRNNLLVIGADVTISKISPKIQIVVENYEVLDKKTEFTTVEQYDENLNQGSIIVVQQGENGLERVSQNVKSVNGEINYVDPAGKETLKAAVPKIIHIGTKYVPDVGSLASWGWPTDSGYTLSSYYGYRQYIFGSSWHSGIDIAGTGYGSNVYAANNGVITTRTWSDSYGWYIIINHNNGYYTLYAHMSRFASNFSVGSTVSRGDIIGYVGATGDVTGPHLHYEIRNCAYFSCAINPLAFYR